MRHGIVTVRSREDAIEMDDNHHVISVTSSMFEELEAIREENLLLYEAIGNQSRAQQKILALFVGGIVQQTTKLRNIHPLIVVL